VLSQLEKYIEKQKGKFLGTFERKNILWNMNTDAVFYDFEKYNELLVEENNELERKWKTRVLVESTPNGNIIMYYDSYKKGFAYYSDLQMNYSTLNAVAMKYVQTYLCRDLFMDETVIPEDHLSPLIHLEKEQEKKEREKEKEKRREENQDYGIDKERLKSGPFAKLKNYKLEGKTKEETKKKESTENKVLEKSSEKWKIISMNKFLYLGKIMNYSILQKIPKKRIQPPSFRNSNKENISVSFGSSNKTQYSEMFDKDFESQEAVFNYRDFKKMLKSSKEN
jgi:hypothetical protein